MRTRTLIFFLIFICSIAAAGFFVYKSELFSNSGQESREIEDDLSSQQEFDETMQGMPPQVPCSNNIYTTEINYKGLIVLDLASKEKLGEALKENGDNALWGISDLKCLTSFDRPGGVGDIHNISALAPLTNLRQINLQGMRLADISPLRGLISLTYLNLSDNVNLSNISFLAGLIQLRELNLYNNRITDVSSLASLVNLKSLSLGFNLGLSDLSALGNLTELEFLYLDSTKVSDLSFLLSMKKLKKLSLMSCYQLKSSSVLEEMTWLEELKLYDSGISEEDCDLLKQKLANTKVNCETIR